MKRVDTNEGGIELVYTSSVNHFYSKMISPQHLVNTASVFEHFLFKNGVYILSKQKGL